MKRMMCFGVASAFAGCFIGGTSDDPVAPETPPRDDVTIITPIANRRGCGLASTLVAPLADAALYIPGSYERRSFLDPDNHLGEDIALLEGTPIYANGPGTVVYSGAATGYGELLVVVEYHFAEPVRVRDGNGRMVNVDTVIGIIGHLRSTPLRDGRNAVTLRPGDCVTDTTIVGYVNDDAHNGDGREHLHFGIRLMDAETARRIDGRYAYRGYDDRGRFRFGFTAPSDLFVADLPPDEGEPGDVPPDEPPAEGGPDDVPPADDPPPPSCHPIPETCNHADDDCNGADDDGLFRPCMTACGGGRETCVAGVWTGCTAPTPLPESCGNDIDDDCNGVIDDGCAAPPPPPPPGCGGHTVRVEWPAGVPSWTFMSDLYGDWHWGLESASSSYIQTFTCVPGGRHRLNGEFPGRIWGCGEWPENVLQTPYGTPRVFVDGIGRPVTASEDAPDLGCNFLVDVGP